MRMNKPVGFPYRPQDGGPRRVGILTLWYSSASHLGCMPNIGVRQVGEHVVLTLFGFWDIRVLPTNYRILWDCLMV